MAEAGPEFSPTQEVRFALVMYGGSSLCIYMNGVAQEFLNLVRSTAPDAPMSANPRHVRQATSTEAVYQRIGQLLSYGEEPKRTWSKGLDVTTRFVVDIISGSSAGGINGVFLGKALANDQKLDQIKHLWVEEGDFDKLLNDGGSVKDDKALPRRRPPESLMNSYRMYRKLLDAFDGMGTVGPEFESPLVEELDLAVTTTDLKGLTLPMKLFDSVILEPRYRNVFRLKYRTEMASGRQQNDFRFNAGLAFAARCTSSFPFVFEPMTLADIDAVLSTERKTTDGSDRPEMWKDVYFPDYDRVGDNYRFRPFSDGGDIDNKPFSYAIDNLAVRRSRVPVVRKLVYVEPDPGRYELGKDAGQWVDPITSVLLAGTLPRAETIREDLDRVRAHNEMARRVADIMKTVEAALCADIPRSSATTGPEPVRTEAATRNWLDERGAEARKRGLAYIVYHRMKVQQTVDRLGTVLAEGAGFEAESDRSTAVKVLVHTWVRSRYADPFEDPVPGDDRPTDYKFLLDFDLEYRMRRINFVERRADELLCHGNPRSSELLQLAVGSELPPDSCGEFDEAVKEAKVRLNAVYVGLRTFRRRLASEAQRLVPPLGIDAAQLDAILVRQPVQQVLHAVSVDDRRGGVDFRTDPGTGPNPRVQGSFTFTALGPRTDGALAADGLERTDGDPAGTRTVAWPADGSGERPGPGLDASSTLVIDLPDRTDHLTLTVSALAWPPTVSAFGDGGQPVAVNVTSDARRPTAGQLTLDAPGMRRVVLSSRTGAVSGLADPADRAAALLSQGDLATGLERLADELRQAFEDAFRAASQGVDNALREQAGAVPADIARRALLFFFDQFDDYDLATLPLLHANEGGLAPVDVLRISPYDATSLVPTSKASTKLAGNQLGHYGAFLSKAWRRNDIMWGRLDAAERIITALLPPGHPERDELVKEAQNVIFREELLGPDMTRAIQDAVLAGDVAAVPAAARQVRDAVARAATPDALREGVRKEFMLPEGPDAEYTMRVASRGTRIVGDILKALAEGRPSRSGLPVGVGAPARWSNLRLPGRVLSRVGQAVWGLVEVAVPGTIAWRIARYWLQLATAIEVFLIVTGIVFNQRAAVRLGWLTLFVTLFLMLAKIAMTALLRGRHWAFRGAGFVAGALVAALAVFGGIRAAHNVRGVVCDRDEESIVRRVSPFDCPGEAAAPALRDGNVE